MLGSQTFDAPADSRATASPNTNEGTKKKSRYAALNSSHLNGSGALLSASGGGLSPDQPAWELPGYILQMVAIFFYFRYSFTKKKDNGQPEQAKPIPTYIKVIGAVAGLYYIAQVSIILYLFANKTSCNNDDSQLCRWHKLGAFVVQILSVLGSGGAAGTVVYKNIKPGGEITPRGSLPFSEAGRQEYSSPLSLGSRALFQRHRPASAPPRQMELPHFASRETLETDGSNGNGFNSSGNKEAKGHTKRVAKESHPIKNKAHLVSPLPIKSLPLSHITRARPEVSSTLPRPSAVKHNDPMVAKPEDDTVAIEMSEVHSVFSDENNNEKGMTFFSAASRGTLKPQSASNESTAAAKTNGKK